MIEFKCPSFDPNHSTEEMATWIGGVMREACDLAAKRCASSRRNRSVYWWCEEVAEARRLCIASRRKWSRSRRRGSANLNAILEADYRAAKRRFHQEICRAKSRAWEELISTVDANPWELPYKC